MITKFQNFQLIKETPDELRYDYDTYKYYRNDAKPFFVEVNPSHSKVERLYLGNFGGTHGDINVSSNVIKSYAGRLWMNIKVISFWVYPNQILFRSIIESLEDKLGITMFDNNWKIEVIKTSQGIKRRDFDPFGDESDPDYYFGDRDERDDNMLVQEVIPIEEYAGSEDVPEELQIQHLMNWQEKRLAKKMGKIHFKGFGSDKTAWDSPHNIKYRQKIYQENKNN